MRYLFAGRFIWFGQICAVYKSNGHGVYIILFCKWINDIQNRGGINKWDFKVKERSGQLSVKELRYMEILKSFRFQLQFVLRKVCDPGEKQEEKEQQRQGKALRAKRKRRGESMSNELNKALKCALDEVLEKFNTKDSEFFVNVSESTQSVIRNLSDTLKTDINNLHKGVLPQFSNNLPKDFCQRSCLKFCSELYSSNLSLLIRLIQPYLTANRKVSFDSEEFLGLTRKLESESHSNKLLLFQEYGFIDLDLPAGVALSRVLEEYSVESKEFLTELIEIEEDFKSMTEVLFSLVKY